MDPKEAQVAMDTRARQIMTGKYAGTGYNAFIAKQQAKLDNVQQWEALKKGQKVDENVLLQNEIMSGVRETPLYRKYAPETKQKIDVYRRAHEVADFIDKNAANLNFGLMDEIWQTATEKLPDGTLGLNLSKAEDLIKTREANTKVQMMMLQLLKSFTGAQMSEGEYKLYGNLFKNYGDQPYVVAGKLRALAETQVPLIKSGIEELARMGATKTAYDFGKAIGQFKVPESAKWGNQPERKDGVPSAAEQAGETEESKKPEEKKKKPPFVKRVAEKLEKPGDGKQVDEDTWAVLQSDGKVHYYKWEED
jgi:hypothetical protein